MNNVSKRTATPLEVSQMYGLSVGTLANMRAVRKGPKYYKFGRKVLYDLTEFETFVKSHPVLTIDDMGGAR